MQTRIFLVVHVVVVVVVVRAAVSGLKVDLSNRYCFQAVVHVSFFNVSPLIHIAT